jgi:N-terminal domain on NACHT_NTPase and P-loop NTPases/NB-ARC domain
MAEAAAIVGLVASIASLVQLSAQVVSRLHEFASKTSDIPESFRSLTTRLPLLTTTLQRVQTQAQAGRLLDDVTKDLKAVVDNTSEQISAIKVCLSKTLPPDSASKLERTLKALKSLAKEDKVQQALEKIHKNIDILVLHQTTRQVDTGDRILEELSKLSVAPPASPKSFGVCLGQAPQIEPDAFIGRTAELQQLRSWLLPTIHPRRQRVVSIVGMGGMGKTQLSLAHVRDCAHHYSSVFWVNANDKASLRQSLSAITAVIFHGSAASEVQSADDEKRKSDEIRRWLSEPGNDQWLLIFDNYDDPHLPGIRSPTGYDIRSFFPTCSQGSILITSRSTKLAFSKQFKLQQLEDVNTSIAILSQRSGRDISQGETLSEFDLFAVVD